MTAETETEQHHWTWFTDKVLPSIFVALSLAVCGAAWWTHQTVTAMVAEINNHQRELDRLNTRVSNLESVTVTKTEQLETLKRVEQQLEIMMLRAGLRPKT